MKFTVTLTKEIEVEFDENSEDFKALWSEYKQSFDSSADYESFSEGIAQQIGRYGVDEFIEGVGFLKHQGENQMLVYGGEYKEREGIVNVNVETDINGKVDFEIDFTSQS